MSENNIRNPKDTKKRIYYSRTYRHLQFDRHGCLLFSLLFVLPLTVLSFIFYDECTLAMSLAAQWFLRAAGGIEAVIKQTVFIPKLGPVHYVCLPSTYPDTKFILINMGVTLLLAWVLSLGRLKGKPLSIYIMISLLVHCMSCVFFLLNKGNFPYTIEDYSELYGQQQVGIWITFIVLSGLIEAFLTKGAVLFRVLTVAAIMVYSFIFATVRYGLFLLLLSRYSLIYMPVMYFSLGPLFDFMYFVMIYSISANKMIIRFDKNHKDEWKWA